MLSFNKNCIGEITSDPPHIVSEQRFMSTCRVTYACLTCRNTRVRAWQPGLKVYL